MRIDNRGDRVHLRIPVLEIVDGMREACRHRAAELRACPVIDLGAEIQRFRATPIPLPIVDEHHRRDRWAWIADEARPGVDGSVVAYRRPAAGAGAAVDITQARYRAA